MHFPIILIVTAFSLLVVIDMVHPNMFPKTIVCVDVKLVEVKHDVKVDEANDDVKQGARPTGVELDVRAQFTNKETFFVLEYILQWVRGEA